MHGKVYLSEGATSKHFTDPIESDISHWWLRCYSKSSFDFLHHVSYLLGARAELGELRLTVERFLGTDDLAIESLFVDVRGDLADLLLVIFCDKPSCINICDHCLRSSHLIWLINTVLRSSSRSVRLRFSHISRALL